MKDGHRAEIESVWREAWEMGSHGSPVSFEEWYAERYAKMIAKAERKAIAKTPQAPGGA